MEIILVFGFAGIFEGLHKINSGGVLHPPRCLDKLMSLQVYGWAASVLFKEDFVGIACKYHGKI